MFQTLVFAGVTFPALGASPLASQALLPTEGVVAKPFDQAPIRYETRETEKRGGDQPVVEEHFISHCFRWMDV